MKRHARIGLALALGIIGWPVWAAETYMSADDYMMASRQERWGFVQGVYDTYGALTGLGGMTDAKLTASVRTITDCATKVSVNELEQAFTVWLDAHPDRWNEKMPALFLAAISEQCAGASDAQLQGASSAPAN